MNLVSLSGQSIERVGKFTPFKCPSRVKFVEALPKTLVGKDQKKELRKWI